jgi:YHS domain-containing protein
MHVTDQSPHRARHGEHDYFFCSARCQTKFVAEPAKYLAGPREPGSPVEAETIYTCPMHPQIRQAGPGSCPICGMTLEPEVPAATEDPSELNAVKRRFWFATVLSAPVVAMAMLPHLLDLHLSDGTSRTLRFPELALEALEGRVVEALAEAPLELLARELDARHALHDPRSARLGHRPSSEPVLGLALARLREERPGQRGKGFRARCQREDGFRRGTRRRAAQAHRPCQELSPRDNCHRQGA